MGLEFESAADGKEAIERYRVGKEEGGPSTWSSWT
jgi:hypothetical protein